MNCGEIGPPAGSDPPQINCGGERASADLASGSIERLHGSVLAVAGAPPTWERNAAAALAAVPGSVLSHASAARLHRCGTVPTSDDIVVTAPMGAHHDLRDVSVRRTRFLPPQHVTAVDGFAVTTLARTLVDLAADMSDGRMRRLIEDELAARRITWSGLVEILHETAARGRPGIGRFRRVLVRIEGDPPTESELERKYVRLLRSHGVPLPRTQVTAPWAERQPGRVDAMYVEQQAIVELDGRGAHARSLAFEEDRRRDQLAVLHGFTTTRFTFAQLASDPDHVVEVSRYLATRPHR